MPQIILSCVKQGPKSTYLGIPEIACARHRGTARVQSWRKTLTHVYTPCCKHMSFSNSEKGHKHSPNGTDQEVRGSGVMGAMGDNIIDRAAQDMNRVAERASVNMRYVKERAHLDTSVLASLIRAHQSKLERLEREYGARSALAAIQRRKLVEMEGWIQGM